jgi:hypothetical protein
MSVFHRMDDLAALTISRFLMLVVRLSAYGGALAKRFTHDSAGTASPAGAPVAGVPSAGDGDTPPEVLAQMKRQQFAARHGTDVSAIEWDNGKLYRELVLGG